MSETKHRIYFTRDAANRNNRRIHMNGTQLCKVYGWSEDDAERRARLVVKALEALSQSDADALS